MPRRPSNAEWGACEALGLRPLFDGCAPAPAPAARVSAVRRARGQAPGGDPRRGQRGGVLAAATTAVCVAATAQPLLRH